MTIQDSTIDKSAMEATIKKQARLEKEEKDRVENTAEVLQQGNSTTSSIKRRITVIGVGDCGTNIASAVKELSGDSVRSVIYNTSSRNENASYDKAIFAKGEDGSGRDREYSKRLFKDGIHEHLHKALEEYKSDYCFITHSLDGGSAGAAPNVAAYVGQNIAKSILLGVIPTLQDDQKSQYNSIKWREDLGKVLALTTEDGKSPAVVGYMLFDNNHFSNEPEKRRHELVNKEAAAAIQVIEGSHYISSDGRSLDNRNLFKLLSHGGRINIYTSVQRIRMNENLDDYLINIIENSSQPKPLNPTAYGILVKGPKAFTDELNLSLQSLQYRYGEAVEFYKHVEESDEVRISLITTGSVEPFERFKQIQTRYNEIKDSRSALSHQSGELNVDDPYNKSNETEFKKPHEINKSALDI